MRGATVRVEARGLGAVVAARYLAGAGVSTLVVATEEAKAAALDVDARTTASVDPTCNDATGFDDLDPAAREVARGASVALDALRALLVPHA